MGTDCINTAVLPRAHTPAGSLQCLCTVWQQAAMGITALTLLVAVGFLAPGRTQPCCHCPWLQLWLDWAPAVNRFRLSLYKSNWKKSLLPPSLHGWAAHKEQTPEFIPSIKPALPTPRRRGSPSSRGPDRYPRLTAGERALALLLSITKSSTGSK